MPRVRWQAAVFIMAACCVTDPAPALAHDPGLSALDLTVTADAIVARVAMAPADARVAAEGGLRVDAFVLASLDVRIDGSRLRARVDGDSVEADSGTTIRVTFDRIAGSQLAIVSHVPDRLARGHRQLLTVSGADGRLLTSRMLSARAGDTVVPLADAAVSGADGGFFLLGVEHILAGYDHLLFLAGLLLGLGRLRDVVRAVTAFTLAHSITLALSVLGVAYAPPALVEPVIALSVVWVGVENLVWRRVGCRWKLTFAFGLVHGFGFAWALRDLGIGAGRVGTVIPLGLFNAGVEAGQMVIAAALWPVIARLAPPACGTVSLSRACSGGVVVAGAYWLIERTLFQ